MPLLPSGGLVQQRDGNAALGSLKASYTNDCETRHSSKCLSEAEKAKWGRVTPNEGGFPEKAMTVPGRMRGFHSWR